MEEFGKNPGDERDPVHITIAHYVIPVFIVIGFFGNILSIAVLRKGSFQRSTTSAVYLLMIAIASLIYIIFYIPFVVKEFVTDGSDAHMWGIISYQCYVGLFILESMSFWVYWMTAVVAVERCIVVGFPNQRKIICRRKYAWVTCGVILAIAFLLHIPRCLQCRPFLRKNFKSPTNSSAVMIMNNLPGYDLISSAFAFIILSTFIPFLIIACSNIMLLVIMIRRKRQKNMHGTDGSEKNPKIHIGAKQEKALAAMVLSNMALYILSQLFVTALNTQIFILGYEYLQTLKNELIGFYSNTLILIYFCFTSLMYLMISSLYRKKVKNMLYSVFRRERVINAETESQRKSDKEKSEAMPNRFGGDHIGMKF